MIAEEDGDIDTDLPGKTQSTSEPCLHALMKVRQHTSTTTQDVHQYILFIDPAHKFIWEPVDYSCLLKGELESNLKCSCSKR